ncbi:uncharacterized protein LOC131650609 [Vicia villosa]|uniref:uncharacterized protein LOC131650609 n=1 Tax=Vicia villosa TaxID=3911 RepID=UPI00273BCF0A|nr:uncharacterized protein LOC131650609 [Vicia villosa]
MGIRGSHSSRNMEDFKRFIEDMNLLDILFIGGRFTWYKGNGTAMSHLDRFLISNKMIDDWRIIDQRVGERDISDHCHIWLNMGKLDQGPKPFRFNTWFKHGGFLPFLKEEWGKLVVEGRGDFVLYEKLKRSKPILRKWNRDIFGWIDLQNRRRRNVITAIMERNGLVEGVVDVKEEVKCHFEELFRDSSGSRPVPYELNFKCLSEEDSMWLDRPFSEFEIKDMGWACDGNKSLGPNWNKCLSWEFIKLDVLKFVTIFYKDAKLTKAATSSFIALVPKIYNP